MRQTTVNATVCDDQRGVSEGWTRVELGIDGAKVLVRETDLAERGSGAGTEDVRKALRRMEETCALCAAILGKEAGL